MNNIAQLLKNPHMLAVVVALCALQIAGIWFPSYATQIDETRKLVMTYALLVAASMPPTPAQVGKAIATGTGDGGKPV